MTKEEAITFLKCGSERTCYDFKIGHCDGCNMRTALDMAIEALKAEPVKHGYWNWFDGVRCSRCNYKLQTTGIPSYCPHCGAKMDEVEE